MEESNVKMVDLDAIAEAARNAYFGPSRRGAASFSSVALESQEKWRDVARAVLTLASPQVAPAMVVVMDEGAREPRIMSWNEMAVGRHSLYTYPAPVAPKPTVLETCNCRWRGEVLVQQCELHQAWQDTLHERADEVRGLRQALAAPMQVASPAWKSIESVPGTPLPLLLRTRAQAIRLETGWHARNLLDAAKEEGDRCNYEAWMHLPLGTLPEPIQGGDHV